MTRRSWLLSAAAFAASTQAAAAPAPSSVRLNQVGILLDGPKRAVVSNGARQPLPWSLIDPSGRMVASGRTTVFGQDRWSGEHVHQVDFSRVRQPGRALALRVGEAASRPFDISASPYGRLPYDALAYFYHNRAGTPIEARFVGEGLARPAGHPDERATCVEGADSKGNVWRGCSYTLEVSGGWYDAGDHGKYVVNAGISLWTLLNLHERLAASGSKLFADGTAAIPERGNRISDLLDEARWQMDFLLKMQVPDGTRLRVPVGAKQTLPGLTFSEIDASGMAHHKLADEKWTALPTRPDRDQEKRQLFPPTTAATLNLAANAAQCARVWRTTDPAYADRCLQAAERAWTAAIRNPEVYALADFTGSGAYGDDELGDELYWAAAELFATTGRAPYRAALQRSPHFRKIGAEPGWGSVAPLGTITLMTSPPDQLPKAELLRVRSAIRAAADRFLAERDRTGYLVPHAGNTVWGSNSNLLNRAMILALAHELTGDDRYRSGVVDAMDYILGRNPLDRSYVTGYGARPMMNPHHRFWANSLDPRFPSPPPGALSGGPNNTAMTDEVAATLKGKCAAQTCWLDDARAYSLNEVAINWNAPLLWVSAWLAERPGERK
jgi:endoglucanase